MAFSFSRNFGEHLTPDRLVREFILPWVIPELYRYAWVDLFCGEGNLVIPLIESVPENRRAEFVASRVWMYDIQEKMVSRTIQKIVSLGVPEKIASSKIKVKDTLERYPEELKQTGLPVFHVTNPPYLYLGYIRKNHESKELYRYFITGNTGLQDLYQVSLNNDSSNEVERMIYIIPSNFLYASSGSNLIRKALLKRYSVKDAVILEKKVFSSTGFNVAILHFQRKQDPKDETQVFKVRKIGSGLMEREMVLRPSSSYRAGSYFDDFVSAHTGCNNLEVKFYLHSNDVYQNVGNHELMAIDANHYDSGKYADMRIQVSTALYTRIMANPIYVRTVDSGSIQRRAGLGLIRKDFHADAIVASKTYRTHPIQLFIDPPISADDSIFLARMFNLYLEHIREATDSEFMTTYKYSQSPYTRKYLGLNQVRSLISTIPLRTLSRQRRNEIMELIDAGRPEEAFILARTNHEVQSQKDP